MARVPENKRIRSHVMGGSETLATTVDFDGTIDSYCFQDDVKLIGFSIHTEFLVTDAHTNADGQINSFVELTRSANRSQDGSIGLITMEKAWNAAIVVGNDDNRKDCYVMFPDGCGYEFDEGEYVNLLGLLEWVGAGGNVGFYANVVLYWVER